MFNFSDAAELLGRLIAATVFALLACTAFAEDKDVEGRGGFLGGLGAVGGAGYGPGLVGAGNPAFHGAVGPGVVAPGVVAPGGVVGPGGVVAPGVFGTGLGPFGLIGGFGYRGVGLGGAYGASHGVAAGGHQGGFQKGVAGHVQGSGAYAGGAAHRNVQAYNNQQGYNHNSGFSATDSKAFGAGQQQGSTGYVGGAAGQQAGFGKTAYGAAGGVGGIGFGLHG
ncbi:uncharacterized protein LOC142576581 [Dermacentor variabilis]|uniref:uncharacterized protein LOC142576581 n=1 Tax=Dermacentor variabilis TaxID=34621 RepID=UPI003F5B4DBA